MEPYEYETNEEWEKYCIELQYIYYWFESIKMTLHTQTLSHGSMSEPFLSLYPLKQKHTGPLKNTHNTDTHIFMYCKRVARLSAWQSEVMGFFFLKHCYRWIRKIINDMENCVIQINVCTHSFHCVVFL